VGLISITNGFLSERLSGFVLLISNKNRMGVGGVFFGVAVGKRVVVIGGIFEMVKENNYRV
jgi:hypothetical protein